LSRPTRRAASAVLAVTTSLALSAPAALAAPTTTDDPVAAAAGWLASQLVEGERVETTFGDDTYPDQGLTADTVFALAGAGVAADAITAATDWLETQLDAYTGTGEEVYAGATAKLALVAVTTGRPATSFGGQDLVARLEGRDDGGRYRDASEWGDFSNTITQSLGVLALHRVDGAAPSDAAVGYLAAQACDDGGFPEALEVDAAACTSNVDATGFAVQALLPFASTDPAAADAAGAAVTWLLGQQGDDGSFGGPDSPANANSTGLAAAALAAAGEDAAVTAARGFLVGLQEGCGDAEPGSIPFDASDPGDVTRATAQAVLGLVDDGLATVSAAGATADVPVLDCPDEQPVDGGEPVDGEEPVDGGEAFDGGAEPEQGPQETVHDDAGEDVQVEATTAEEPREGTEAAPGEMPRTGSEPLWLALLGVSLLGGGVLTLRRATAS
jgi:LPXTG-motif cell wall-anchored protein